MDSVRRTFDKWAKNGRAELMEKEHGKNVIQFLKTVSFDKPFSFLDVGCGNGWVVRRIAEEHHCKKVIGIDKSKNMTMAETAEITKPIEEISKGKKARYVEIAV